MAEATKTPIGVRYQTGDRQTILIRGHRIVTDQPVAAGGEDQGPTPTELFVASLAACVGFYAERFLRRHGLPVEGLRVATDYEMSTDRPARVTSIGIRLELPEDLPAKRRNALLAVVGHCTVHNSLQDTPSIRVEVEGAQPAA